MARARVYSPHTPAWLYCRLRTSPSDIKIPCTGCRGTFRTREVLSLFLICYRYVWPIAWLRNCCKLEIYKHSSSIGNLFYVRVIQKEKTCRYIWHNDFWISNWDFLNFFFNFSIDPFTNYTFLYIIWITIIIVFRLDVLQFDNSFVNTFDDFLNLCTFLIFLIFLLVTIKINKNRI